jgi:hypothetical protein
LLAEDPLLAPHAGRLAELSDPARCTGRAEAQVVEYVAGEVDPLLADRQGSAKDAAARSARAEV